MDMKKIVRLVVAVVVIALLIAAAAFIVRLIGGLISGAFNAILGVLVVAALVIIVGWMFWYAGKHK